jgi:hypothetical protein
MTDPLDDTVPVTVLPAPFLTKKLGPLAVAPSICSLKVALIDPSTLAHVSLFDGVVYLTEGGVVSGALPVMNFQE